MTEFSTKSIAAGDHDHDLDLIAAAVKARKTAIALDIPHGSKVRLTDAVRPQYLRGVTGTIVDRTVKRGGKVSFRMEVDEQFRTERFSRFLDPYTNTIGGPAELFELVD